MKITIFFLIFILSYNVFAIINIPEAYSTIQEGINAATNGDTVLVSDGIYTGSLNRNLTWNGNEKHLVIRSVNGPEFCTIDCQQNGRAFTFIETWQDSTDIIEGFTLINGYISAGGEVYGGGAICCDSASPTIINNIIRNNSADASNGGAISLFNSHSKILGNIIKHNAATFSGFPGACSGGGISIYSGAIVIKDNIIRNNHTFSTDFEAFANGGGIYAYSSELLIINNLIYNNGAHCDGFSSSGGGMCLSYCGDDSQIVNNTIFYNYAESGSGIRCNQGQIINNIIVDNSHVGVSGFYSTNTALIENNNVWGNPINYFNLSPEIGDTSWGTNNNGTACDSFYNISEDPLFCSNFEGEFFLSQLEAGQDEHSPCVNAGYGLSIDLGLVEYSTRTDLEWDSELIDMGFHYKGIEFAHIDENIISIKNCKLYNYPNPFNPSTTIEFSITNESDVELKIYNIKGQKVKQLVSQQLSAGQHSVVWDGMDSNSKKVATGLYFYILKIDDKTKVVRKCLLLK